jgi:guanidinopropionase
MDNKKLEALRAKYGDGSNNQNEGELFDRVIRFFETNGANKDLPYSGISTFLDAPHTKELEGLDVALIGIPMDLAVTNRSGARQGPRAVRAIERIGPYNHGLDVIPFETLKCADVGDVPFRSRYSLEKSIEDIEAFINKVKTAGVIPLCIGGDHSVSHPILKALGKDGPVGMVHIDAHCDTAGEFDCSKFNHGGPFRNAVLDGVLDPERTIQIGIRGNAEYLWQFSYDAGMTVIHADEFARMGVDAVIKKALEVVGDKPFYISLDVDGIDPAFTPGTGTPEVGGLTPREVQQFFWGLKGKQIIGGDVVEVAPQYDGTTNTAQVGAQMAFEILSLIAFSPK